MLGLPKTHIIFNASLFVVHVKRFGIAPDHVYFVQCIELLVRLKSTQKARGRAKNLHYVCKPRSLHFVVCSIAWGFAHLNRVEYVQCLVTVRNVMDLILGNANNFDYHSLKVEICWNFFFKDFAINAISVWINSTEAPWKSSKSKRLR